MAPKVVSTQDAVLSDYEVLQHVKALKLRFKDTGRLRFIPKNLATILDKVESHLERPGAPLEPNSTVHPAWTDATVARLVKHLKPFNLLKGEMLMILNNRPASRSQLEPILEESSTRFTPEQLDEIIAIVYDQATADGEYDVADDVPEVNGDAVEGSTAATTATTTRKRVDKQTASSSSAAAKTPTQMAPDKLVAAMNAIIKGKATHTSIEAETREKLINQWESNKAQFDQVPLEEWDSVMADFMTKLYGPWVADSRLPDDEEAMAQGLDIDDVVGREMMMVSEVDKSYDWMLEPPAGRLPRAVKKA